jgi:hypothetical protein
LVALLQQLLAPSQALLQPWPATVQGSRLPWLEVPQPPLQVLQLLPCQSPQQVLLQPLLMAAQASQPPWLVTCQEPLHP